MGVVYLLSVIAGVFSLAESSYNFSWSLNQTIAPTTGAYLGQSVVIGGPNTNLPGGLVALAGSLFGSGYVLSYTRPSLTSPWVLTQNFTGAGAVIGSHFGYSLAIASALTSSSGYGYIAAIGANQPSSCGSAYIYSSVGTTGVWNYQFQLTPPVCESGMNFGVSVAVSAWTGGAVVFVGAPFSGVNGQVFMYVSFSLSTIVNTQTWTLQQTLTPASNVGGINFGYSVNFVPQVDVINYVLAIGAPRDTYIVNGTDVSGSVYVYSLALFSNAVFATRIVPTVPVYGGLFGKQILLEALESTTLAVSSVFATSPTGILESGSVYVYTSTSPSAWTPAPASPLFAPVGFAYSEFGFSLAFDPVQELFMVGAPFQGNGSASGFVCGNAYSFALKSANTDDDNSLNYYEIGISCPITTGTPLQPAFGSSVAVYAGTALVGALNANMLFSYHIVSVAPGSPSSSGLPAGAVYAIIVCTIGGIAIIAGGLYYILVAAPAAAAAGAGSSGAGVASASVSSPMGGNAASFHNNI